MTLTSLVKAHIEKEKEQLDRTARDNKVLEYTQHYLTEFNNVRKHIIKKIFDEFKYGIVTTTRFRNMKKNEPTAKAARVVLDASVLSNSLIFVLEKPAPALQECEQHLIYEGARNAFNLFLSDIKQELTDEHGQIMFSWFAFTGSCYALYLDVEVILS